MPNINKLRMLLMLIIMASVMTPALTGCSKTDRVITFGNETGSFDREENAEGASETESTDMGDAPDSPETGEIYVYVSGAVKSPGVYKLLAGSRVVDALDAAGGFGEGADESFVNLAALLEDGEQIDFPLEGETGDTVNVGSGKAVNINTADKEKLCTIPGIGEAKADAIINFRENNSRFSSKEDIMKVSGIGRGLYDRISEYICVK